MTSPSEIVDWLTSHGSEDRIAEFLEDEGIQGIPRSGGTCALAAYIRRETGAITSIYPYQCRVGPVEAPGRGWFYLGDDDGVSFVLSNLVASFARRFDGGHYPNLVKRSRRDAA